MHRSCTDRSLNRSEGVFVSLIMGVTSLKVSTKGTCVLFM